MTNVPRPVHHSMLESVGDFLHLGPPSPTRQDVLNASHIHEIETEDAEKTDLTHDSGHEQARNSALVSNRVDHRTRKREERLARKRRDADERVDEKENATGWTEDKELVERMWSIHWSLNSAGDVDKLVTAWKGTADGILIFTGLFSATVAAFILESYKSLIPGSSSTAVLAELAAQRSLLSRSLGLEVLPSASIPLALDSRLPESAVRLNILWLFSLCISISCALGAVIMQQWARRLERICGQKLEDSQSLGTESRLRLRLIASVTRHHVPTLINAIMSMLHVAVFLFFGGLIEFFWSINRTVAITILVLQSAFGALYLLFTITPLIAEVSVIQTPLTSAIWKTLGALTAIWLFFKTLVGARSESANSDSASETTQVSARSSKPVQVWERLTEAIKNSPNRFLHDYKNTAEYSFAKTESAPATSAEIKGLISTFEVLRIKNASNYLDSLTDFCAFLVGICSYLSLEDSAGASKIAHNFLTLPSTSRPALFSTWESWLVYVLKKHIAEKRRSVQFIALCMRMHWFMLLRYPSDETPSVFSRLQGSDFCDPKVHSALESLHKTHPKLSVAIAARCFQACLAADLPIPRFYSDEALCWKLVSAPESVHIHSFGLPQSPGDRSLIIIMGLIHDMGEIEKRTYTSREARKVILKQRSQVLSAVIESMVEKVGDDIPYQDISNKFVGFCHEHHRYCRELGIEPALNKVLAELGERELPELSPSPQPPPSPAPADTDEDDRKPNFNPITAIQDVADKSIQMLQRKRRAWVKDEGGEAAAGASNKETDAEV